MIKQIKYIAAILLFVACSKDKSLDIAPIIEPSFEKEYGISRDTIDDFGCRMIDNSNEVYFCGLIHKKFWVGGYDTITKKKVFNYLSKDTMPDTYRKYEGYGEYKDIYPHYTIHSLVHHNNNIVFNLLISYGERWRFYKSYLYFINEGKLVKKMDSWGKSPICGGSYVQIHKWHKSLLLYNYDKRCCVAYQGDVIYEFNYKDAIADLTPLSQEEGLKFSGIKKLSWERINIKENKTVWESEITLGDVEENAKLENTTVSKSGSKWTYIFDYIFYDGTKYTKAVIIDINSGEIEQ